MRPEILVFLIPILGILTGMLSILLKHREKMSGIDGKRGSQTVHLLTETLEKEHLRIQQLEQRIETLEMIVTDEKEALNQSRRLARHSADAAAEAEAEADAPRAPRQRLQG